MGGLTETTKREFAKRILEIMNSNSEELQTAGVDVSVKSSELSGMIDAAFTAEERQLRARADSEAATRVSQEATDSAYKSASNAVDLLVGALGKNNTLSKRLRAVRDEIANEALRGKRSENAGVS